MRPIITAVLAVFASAVAANTVGCTNRRLDEKDEADLNANLQIVRAALNDYRRDNARCPETLEQLVKNGYIRYIPVDPTSGGTRSWRLVHYNDGGCNVVSGSMRIGSDGRPYAAW